MKSIQPIGLGATDRSRAFSLIELVIVVTIIGVIAAIAVPRISSAATNASANSLEATLANVRKAIDVYYAEHDRYPGYDDESGLPDDDEFVDQLLLYTNTAGETEESFDNEFKLGPFLRRPFPTNPANKLNNVFVKLNPTVPDPAAGTFGWIAVLSNGYFGISATDAQLDDLGIKAGSRKARVRAD